jgi:hypothetical protein
MEDYREDGYNAGRGQAWRNDHHEPPQTDGDRYSYCAGYEEGERRRRVADEVDRELYGDDRTKERNKMKPYETYKHHPGNCPAAGYRRFECLGDRANCPVTGGCTGHHNLYAYRYSDEGEPLWACRAKWKGTR